MFQETPDFIAAVTDEVFGRVDGQALMLFLPR